MRSIINKILNLPKWCALCIILLYAMLATEYFSTINDFYFQGIGEIPSFMETLIQLHLFFTFISALVVWIVFSYIFHLSAMLFNGQGNFSTFLMAGTYSYIIPSICLFVVIILLGDINIMLDSDVSEYLEANDEFTFLINSANYSFIFYYMTLIFLIRYIYKIAWLYAFLSVFLPMSAIVGLTMFIHYII